MRKPRPKKVNYTLIREKDEPAMYEMLAELIAANHQETLGEANVALAWRVGLKKDPDGLLILGKMKKVTDLDRELHRWDFVIILNREAWQDLDDAQRRALVDHECCHGSVARNKDGSVKKNDRGRPVFRLRKHDIEEFREVVERHGLYKHDLESFAAACAEKRKAPLFAADDGGKPTRPRLAREG